MENKIIKIIVLLVFSTSLFAQKTKQDTLKMFEGHWMFKMAMNTGYTPQELEDTYLKDARGGKIHIIENRIYGNFYGHSYISSSIEISNISINSGQKYLDNKFSKKELERMASMGIVQDIWINISEKNTYYESLPFGYLILLPKQRYLINGMDQTAFFLERDKSEYKFIGVKETPILREDKSPTLNKVLENEEVEVIEKGEQYTKIRYWGKALIIGWVKTADLKTETSHSEYWNIYKNNTIRFQILNTKSIIYNENYQKTNKYLIKGDTVEVLEEKGYFLKIKYKNITGLIPRMDVEGYNTFRITKPKAYLYSSPNKPTKMYVLKGDDVELVDRQDDWLKIRFKGKKVVEGWIKRSDVE
ncbi:MAG: hypothetical protein ACK4R6_14495 [Spirosomataceae bacterium]